MTEQDKRPKRKRRWLRFSLRTFLILLTIFCVWLGWYLYRVEQQRAAVKWVRANGGTVGYDYENNAQDLSAYSQQPDAPTLIVDMFGVDCFSTVTTVSLADMQVSDLTPLAGLTNLEVLTLDGTQVSDLAPLAGLTNLIYLVLNGSQASDLTPLATLTNLKVLNLERTRVGVVTPLAGLTNLEVLTLDGTQVSDVTPLAGLTNLEWLFLSETQVSDVTPLASLKNLTILSINQTQVSGEDVEKLKQVLPNCDISH